jgi:GNAT superfamily N-acetyltransferase
LGEELAGSEVTLTLPPIRNATISDAPALAELITQLGYPTTPAQMQTRLPPLLVEPVNGTLVAELGGRVVGMIGLRIDRAHEYDGVQGRILALVVDASARGNGIGTALVAAGERWAAERGAGKIVVTTAKHRERTHEFYRALQYDFTGLRFGKVLSTPR